MKLSKEILRLIKVLTAGIGMNQLHVFPIIREIWECIQKCPGQSFAPGGGTERTVFKQAVEAEQSGTRPASPSVVGQLQNLRQNLERRKESLQYEEDNLGETWQGLAEL